MMICPFLLFHRCEIPPMALRSRGDLADCLLRRAIAEPRHDTIHASDEAPSRLAWTVPIELGLGDEQSGVAEVVAIALAHPRARRASVPALHELPFACEHLSVRGHETDAREATCTAEQREHAAPSLPDLDASTPALTLAGCGHPRTERHLLHFVPPRVECPARLALLRWNAQRKPRLGAVGPKLVLSREVIVQRMDAEGLEDVGAVLKLDTCHPFAAVPPSTLPDVLFKVTLVLAPFERELFGLVVDAQHQARAGAYGPARDTIVHRVAFASVELLLLRIGAHACTALRDERPRLDVLERKLAEVRAEVSPADPLVTSMEVGPDRAETLSDAPRARHDLAPRVRGEVDSVERDLEPPAARGIQMNTAATFETFPVERVDSSGPLEGHA